MNEYLPNIDSELEVIEPAIYVQNGRNMTIALDQAFGQCNPKLNNFIIRKSAYAKNLEQVCRYANTFFKYYDTDNEFLSGLIGIKYSIDDMNTTYTLNTFTADIAEFLFTDNVVKKIFNMVDDYYSIDLTPADDVKGIDLHALQFTNEHGKCMMALSIAYKLTIPIVCHYYQMCSKDMAEVAHAKGEAEPTIKEYLYHIFASYFPLFQGDSELFNKIAMTVNTHLMSTQNSDATMWNRARNKKITPTTYTDKLVATVVVDLLPKAVFEKNIIYLIQVAIPYQIKQTLLAKDKYDFSDISSTSKTDDLSGLEKLEATNARINDLDIVIAEINIPNTIKAIERKFGIYPTDEEMKYYKDHLTSYPFSELILQYFAKYFGGCCDLKSIGRKNYRKLLIIFKHIMSRMGFVYLPQILSGNLSQTIKKRKIASRQLQKITQMPRFKKAMAEYSSTMDPNNNAVITTIAALLNTPIEYCDYANPEAYGVIIKVDIDILVSEYLEFLALV